MIFKWDTLTEVGDDTLYHRGRPVPGKMYEVKLTSGKAIRVWRADDGRQYFCHGLTFGGKDAPGGVISPYTGTPVETILQEHYQLVPEAEAKSGDILVWRGIAPETTPHSAVLTAPLVTPGRGYLDLSTRLQTKNGLSPEKATTLGESIDVYGESYNVYRRL